MSRILSILSFAAAAAAAITTTVMMPSNLDSEEVGYYGSVVGAENGKTTLALVYDNDTDTDNLYRIRSWPNTFTFQGSTSFEAVYTTSESFEQGDMTISVGCSVPAKTRAKPTCTYSTNGALAYKSMCSPYSTYTDVYTTTYEYTYSSDRYGPESTETYVETVDYRSYIPSFCTEGTTIPESYAVDTMTLSRSRINEFQVVITAGEEKLSATAGSSASGSGPAPTGTGAQGTAGNGTSPTGPSAAASAPINTGAAMPMITAAPMLAGLGAAVAALVL